LISLPVWKEEVIVVYTPTFVELLSSELVDKNEIFGINDWELLCWVTVNVTWLEDVDVIDEILWDSVFIIVEKLDGLLDGILLEKIGFNEIETLDVCGKPVEAVDTNWDDIGILIEGLVSGVPILIEFVDWLKLKPVVRDEVTLCVVSVWIEDNVLLREMELMGLVKMVVSIFDDVWLEIVFSEEAVPILISYDVSVCKDDWLVNATDGVDTAVAVFLIAALV